MKFHNVKRVPFKHRFGLEQSEHGILLTDTLELGLENMSSFESVMQGYDFTALEKIYDCDDPRTFETICPKCNTARILAGTVSCCF